MQRLSQRYRKGASCFIGQDNLKGSNWQNVLAYGAASTFSLLSQRTWDVLYDTKVPFLREAPHDCGKISKSNRACLEQPEMTDGCWSLTSPKVIPACQGITSFTEKQSDAS